MKVKTLSALAGLGGALIMSTSANAAFVGSHAELHTTVNVAGVNRDVYRVYMLFDDAGDTLSTVYGTPTSPFFVDLHGATAFNPPTGGNVPNNADGVNYSPNSEWDSYATIGLAAGYVGDVGAGLILTPGFPTFITNAGIAPNTDFAYTTPGPMPQGMAGNGTQFGNLWGVLVMQITVNAGNASPTGSLGLTYFPGVDGTGSPINVDNVAWAVPAPGALALLGLAGLVGSRRRRA